MKATKRRIYYEEEVSGKSVSVSSFADKQTWEVIGICDCWQSKDNTAIYIVTIRSAERRDGQDHDWREDSQLLGCDTDAAAIRATQRLFGQRVQALAGTISTIVEVEVTP